MRGFALLHGMRREHRTAVRPGPQPLFPPKTSCAMERNARPMLACDTPRRRRASSALVHSWTQKTPGCEGCSASVHSRWSRVCALNRWAVQVTVRHPVGISCSSDTWLFVGPLDFPDAAHSSERRLGPYARASSLELWALIFHVIIRWRRGSN